MSIQVYCGNIGCVYDGRPGSNWDPAGPHAIFREYRRQSRGRTGRAAGESVVMLSGDNILREHVGRYDKNREN